MVNIKLGRNTWHFVGCASGIIEGQRVGRGDRLGDGILVNAELALQWTEVGIVGQTRLQDGAAALQRGEAAGCAADANDAVGVNRETIR